MLGPLEESGIGVDIVTFEDGGGSDSGDEEGWTDESSISRAPFFSGVTPVRILA